MLGAERTVEALRRGAAEDPSLPAGWTVLPHGAEDVREFLAGLDFYLYLDNPRAHEAFGRTLLEAAASGVLTIAHPKHEPTFGPTLDYAEPGEAQQLVARYLADSEAYQDRVRRTQDEVRRRFSTDSFLAHLLPLLKPSAPPGPPPAGRPGQVAPEQSGDGEPPGSAAAGAALELGRPDLEGPADRTDAAGLDVLTLRLRSVADAERADALTLVASGRAQLRAWLGTAPTHPAEPDVWRGLVEGAPDCLVAALLRSEGWLYAWRRTGDGWREDAWPAHAAPTTLRLAGRLRQADETPGRPLL